MLFYWFCEAEQTEPSESPVALWTNGGPGSDSLGGFFTELGPFIANEHDNGATLRRNPYTWNLIANMLYLTHPTGIGYSYSADDVNVHTDESDGADNAKFLRKFFAAYPEFATNEFWLTGAAICATLAAKETAFYSGWMRVLARLGYHSCRLQLRCEVSDLSTLQCERATRR